jgi:CheY-like chemotaxis protein
MARVLIVDNDREMLKLLQQHLESEGFHVRAVTTGADAIALLKQEDCDLVLTDLVMDEPNACIRVFVWCS